MGSVPGPGATWGEFIARIGTVQELLGRLQRTRLQQRVAAASWNVRWIRDPVSLQGHAKRKALLRLTQQGYITMIQETHWEPGRAGVWAPLLPHTTVVESPAIVEEGGDPKGGVAILVPAPAVVEREVRVPGVLAAATVKWPGRVERRTCV
eukprot:755210-Prorocentrum_lima.AAC.1